MTAAEDEFLHRLIVFQDDAEGGTRYFYAYLAIHAKRSEDEAALHAVLEGYVSEGYEVEQTDLRRIRRYVRRYRKVYFERYRAIRHQVFAHKEVAHRHEVEALFQRTRVRDLERIFVFLMRIHQALQDAFHNGRKPVLRPMTHAVKLLKEKELDEWTVWCS